MGSHTTRGLLAALTVALLLSACGASTPEGYAAPQPRDGKAGLRLTGTVAGKQVAVSDGTPRLLLGDCDPAGGPTDDVCFISRSIDGTVLALIIRNPGALEAGSTLPVGSEACTTASDCAQVTDAAVIDVRVGEGRLQRAREGSLRMAVVETGARYAGTVRLVLGNGSLNGEFDVVPRPPR